MKWKLTLAFDGTAYHGWQSQPSGRGVQNHLENGLARLFPSRPTVVSSSRTDAGVHAWGMVVHFEVSPAECRMDAHRLRLAINAMLPESIRVRAAHRVPAAFHARFDAIGKEYHYRIWNHPVMHPLLVRHAWHLPRKLDLEPMREAARLLIGRHDFSAFTSSRGAILENAVRTLRRCDFRREGHEITVILEGDGFLYKMCRALVGTLVTIGAGRSLPDRIPAILSSGERRQAAMNAPAHGLILWKVRHDLGRSTRMPAEDNPQS